MALRKITDEEIAVKGVAAAPDVLNGTAAENKRLFDRLVRELVAVCFNSLVSQLEALGVENILQTASAEMKYLRVTAEGVVQYSADGETWTAVHSGASGTGSAGGGVAVGSVLYNAAQNLTDAQKEQARANIGAVSAAELKESTGSISSALDTINGEVV